MDFAVAVPIITALVQALKMAFLPSRFAILVAIVLGILYSGFSNNIFNFQTVIFGVTVGLASSGIYDVAKQGVTEVKNLRK